MADSWILLADRPAFPDACACCLAPADRHLLIASKFKAAESLLKDVDRPWKVPYCETCVAHVDHSWAVVGSLKRRWGITAVCMCAPGLIFHALLVPMLIVFLTGTAIVKSISKARIKRVKLSPGCATPGPAVLRKGPDRDRYFVRLLNPGYAERFTSFRNPATQN